MGQIHTDLRESWRHQGLLDYRSYKAKWRVRERSKVQRKKAEVKQCLTLKFRRSRTLRMKVENLFMNFENIFSIFEKFSDVAFMKATWFHRGTRPRISVQTKTIFPAPPGFHTLEWFIDSLNPKKLIRRNLLEIPIQPLAQSTDSDLVQLHYFSSQDEMACRPHLCLQ